jgi:hypothetical protein
VGALAAEEAAPVEAIAIRDLCRRLALELETLRQIGMRLEQCACAGEGGLDIARVRELQQFDILLQHLAALRDFLTKLPDFVSVDMVVDATAALNRVLLADLRQRLAGAPVVDRDDDETDWF